MAEIIYNAIMCDFRGMQSGGLSMSKNVKIEQRL
jgi:hypothetical protein